MPYEIRGQYVYNSETGERKNKKPLNHARAVRYMRALYAVEGDNGSRMEGKSIAEKAAITKQEADGAHPASHYLIVEDPQSPSTWHLRVRNAQGALDPGLMGGAWAALHGGYRGNRYEGPGKDEAIRKLTALYAEQQRPLPTAKKATNDARQRATGRLRTAAAKRRQATTDRKQSLLNRLQQAVKPARQKEMLGSLTVYKDGAGAWRWLGVSSTAFRDREGEIVSTAALEDDVARSYKAIADGLAQDHGPLRFWHVPGLDLGRCDFRMVYKRSLIEGGMLFSEKEARLIKRGDQMSLAFAYPPAAFVAGIFKAIVSFERSITPAGRAANPYTAIATEGPMNLAEKLKEWLARGGDPAQLEAVISEQDAREKGAVEAGVAFKADGMSSGGDQPDAATAPAPEGDAIPDEAAAPEGDDLDVLVEILGQAIAPLVAKIDAIAEAVGGIATAEKMAQMHQGMSGMLDELKACVGGYQKQKDDEAAQIRETLTAAQQQVAALETRLKELEGDQPAAIARGYRASQDPDTATIPDRLKDAGPKADPLDKPLAAIAAMLRGQ